MNISTLSAFIIAVIEIFVNYFNRIILEDTYDTKNQDEILKHVAKENEQRQAMIQNLVTLTNSLTAEIIEINKIMSNFVVLHDSNFYRFFVELEKEKEDDDTKTLHLTLINLNDDAKNDPIKFQFEFKIKRKSDIHKYRHGTFETISHKISFGKKPHPSDLKKPLTPDVDDYIIIPLLTPTMVKDQLKKIAQEKARKISMGLVNEGGSRKRKKKSVKPSKKRHTKRSTKRRQGKTKV